MRLLVLSKLRRPRPSPPPPLYHFFSLYSSSSSSSPSSHSFFSSSIIHHHHGHCNHNIGRSSEIYWRSPHHGVSFSREFSTESSLPEPSEPFILLRPLISLLDCYHDATGFPWWIIISSSTLAMRLALLPLLVVQLKKLKRIGEMLSKLPPPFPPPLSGRSFRDQFALFWKEKEAAGCPSLLWFAAPYAVQIPCFFLCVSSVRRMSLDHHPGFDSGGTLWFQNLTEYPHGGLGLIFPLCITALHLANVQFSLRKSSLQNLPGTLGLLAKAYKVYLQVLTLPILIATLNVPQGSLVYWLTNSTLSLLQLICLRHPNVVQYLGLPEMKDPVVAPTVKERGSGAVPDITILTLEGEISARSLSPDELVPYSIKILASGRKDTAVALLRVALEKDPEYVRALLVLGQTLLHVNQIAEGVECLEKAISKLLVNGYPTEVENLDLLILSSQWAGVGHCKQGKMEEGLSHLERIGQLEEPEDSKTKSHYYDGLLLLSSTLTIVGRGADALKYLEKAAAYNPAYSKYVEELKSEPRDFGSDLSDKGRYL
ncbi:hypothetical protein ACS0TY_035550 [Phlomoides rotata]